MTAVCAGPHANITTDSHSALLSSVAVDDALDDDVVSARSLLSNRRTAASDDSVTRVSSLVSTTSLAANRTARGTNSSRASPTPSERPWPHYGAHKGDSVSNNAAHHTPSQSPDISCECGVSTRSNAYNQRPHAPLRDIITHTAHTSTHTYHHAVCARVPAVRARRDRRRRAHPTRCRPTRTVRRRACLPATRVMMNTSSRVTKCLTVND
jgi:hypothetical protein